MGFGIRALAAGALVRIDVGFSDEGVDGWVMVGHSFQHSRERPSPAGIRGAIPELIAIDRQMIDTQGSSAYIVNNKNMPLSIVDCNIYTIGCSGPALAAAQARGKMTTLLQKPFPSQKSEHQADLLPATGLTMAGWKLSYQGMTARFLSATDFWAIKQQRTN